MDSATGARFLDQILLNTNQHIQAPLLSTADMPLDQAQSHLLTNANTRGSRFQYFTEEELELFAVNPPLEPGHIKIAHIFVVGLDGKTFILHNIHSNAPILYLHRLIEQRTQMPINYQRLSICDGCQDYFSTVAECKVKNESTIRLAGRLLGGPPSSSDTSPPVHLLDDKYHLDLTNLTTDDDQTFYRGGTVYNRPCGWMRFALKIEGENNIWLDNLLSKIGQFTPSKLAYYHSILLVMLSGANFLSPLLRRKGIVFILMD